MKRLALLALVLPACFPGPIEHASDVVVTTTEDSASDAASADSAEDSTPTDTTVSDSGGTETTTTVVDSSESDGETVVACPTPACDDGDPCTTQDECTDGVCAGRSFTSVEAANWVMAAGGEGADAALDSAPYDDDEVVVVGAFEGTLELPGGFSLDSAGGVDAFVLRLTDRGQVTRAARLGAATDEGASLVAVAPDRQVVVALHALDEAQTVRSASLVWLFENGNVAATVALPGFVTAMTAVGTDQVYVLCAITGDVTVALADGGQTEVHPNADRAALVMRLSRQGVVWAKAVIGPGRSVPISIAPTSGGDVWASMVLSANTSFASEVIVGAEEDDAGFVVRLDGAGTVRSSSKLASAPALAFNSEQLFMTRIAGDFEAADETHLTPVAADLTPACEATLSADQSAQLGAWGLGVPAADGSFALYGAVYGDYDFSNGIVADSSGENAAFVHYDATCHATGVWLAPFASLDDGPAALRFAMSDFGGYFSRPAYSGRGALVVASYNRLALAFDATFDEQVLVPDGPSDVVIGGFSRATLWGCATED